jgi:hypothetical protein
MTPTAFPQYPSLREFLDSTTSNCFRFARRIPVILCVGVLLFLCPWSLALASTWTRVTNLAPSGAGVMLQLTDGTVMVQQGGSQNWMRLTPNASGSYINGVWNLNPIAPMSTPRLYFASHVLPDGRVWLLGGEYSGPGLVSNWSGTAEIYDPLTNTWSSAASYPPTLGCPSANRFGGFITAGSPIVTGVLSTSGWQPGWSVAGFGIPAGATIASVDSPTQIHLSVNATVTTGSVMTLTTLLSGNTVAASNIITGIPSTSGLQTGWGVAGAGIPVNATIISIDSATQIRISANATATASGVPLTLTVTSRPSSCFGDDPTMLLPSGKILAGNLSNSLTYIYDPATNLWSSAIPKVHNDRSDEETWARMSDGTVLTYDLFQSVSTGGGYAERFNPVTNSWSGISPSAGTAGGFIPQLSSSSIGSELGGILRLYDDRMFVIGATGHTALYTRATNTWAAGPDLKGTLGGTPFLFSADDAPAAILPNGHVIMAVDAGLGLTTSGNTISGSPIITGIPSTASLQLGWAVSGSGIPAGATVSSIDSSSQVHISANATVTANGGVIKFGATFSKPTVLLDYDPVAETISPVLPALPDANLNSIPSYVTRMLMLPTGELLFSDSSNQLWVYTSDGVASPGLKPAITGITRNGNSFLLSGTQITGQSSGVSYGDDAEMDEDYPIIRLVGRSGNVYYARTTNWSPIGVGTGSTPQTVSFTISPSVPLGVYSLIVSAAGISSEPVTFLFNPKKINRDFNFDGNDDVLWRDPAGNVSMWLISGNTVVADSFIANIWTGWSIAGAGDFNGDGKADILWRDVDGNVAIWLMDGSSVAGSSAIGNVWTGWSVAGVGDFNGDGKSDILWRSVDGDVAMWLMNGTTIAGYNTIGNIWTGWSIVGTGDFNGDGKADILWRDTAGNISVWFMDGFAVSGYSSIANQAMTASIAGVGDFNGDGKADILWRDTFGNVSMWLMNGGQILSDSFVASVSIDWKIAGSGDFDGNGKSDVLWRDGAGNIAIWWMDGATVTSYSIMGNVSSRIAQ